MTKKNPNKVAISNGAGSVLHTAQLGREGVLIITVQIMVSTEVETFKIKYLSLHIG